MLIIAISTTVLTIHIFWPPKFTRKIIFSVPWYPFAKSLFFCIPFAFYTSFFHYSHENITLPITSNNITPTISNNNFNLPLTFCHILFSTSSKQIVSLFKFSKLYFTQIYLLFFFLQWIQFLIIHFFILHSPHKIYTFGSFWSCKLI